MQKGERYTRKVKVLDYGVGQTLRTSDYGARYILQTEHSEILYWDTLSGSMLDKLGCTLTISFTVKHTGEEVPWLSSRGYEIKNVRVISMG